eukprot:SAG11_NODE_5264_length_1612_cov_0.860542_1_plen_49_part_00
MSTTLEELTMTIAKAVFQTEDPNVVDEKLESVKPWLWCALDFTAHRSA